MHGGWEGWIWKLPFLVGAFPYCTSLLQEMRRMDFDDDQGSALVTSLIIDAPGQTTLEYFEIVCADVSP
jgi:hypothetical protein